MQLHIGFLLFRLFPLYCLVLAMDSLRLANRYGAAPPFAWSLLSEDGKAVEASNAMRMGVEGPLRAEPSLTHLIVLAGDAPRPQDPGTLAKHLRALRRGGAALGAVDSGAFVLAQAKVLGPHRPALHPTAQVPFAEAYPGLAGSDQPVNVEPGYATCAGGISVIPMMLEIIAQYSDAALARTVQADMLYEASPGLGPAPPRGLERALRIMAESLEDPLTLPDLAEAARLSQRHLNRLFVEQLGVTPMRHFLTMRLRRAQQLLYQSDLGLTEIAFVTGFSSLSAFSRAFRSEFGAPPSEALKALRLRGHANLVPPARRGQEVAPASRDQAEEKA